ncbi:MAG: hypothetical protein IJT72_10630 [Lachnospiraceae bacterium]|nr:hypothetical protein [Lachnospiraceae bacterium]
MKENIDSLNEKELLKELLKAQKKTLLQTRIAAVTSFIFCVAMGISLCIIIPRFTKTLEHANSTLEKTDTMVENAKQSFANIDEMVEKVDVLVTTNTETVNQVMEDIENIKFDELNQAIEDFSDVVEPLAGFVNSF